jgi:hypothetical protein
MLAWEPTRSLRETLPDVSSLKVDPLRFYNMNKLTRLHG